MIRRPPRSTRTDTLFPYTTLFRSCRFGMRRDDEIAVQRPQHAFVAQVIAPHDPEFGADAIFAGQFSKMASGGNNFLFVGKPLPGQHVSNRRSAPRQGLARKSVV